MKIFSLIVLAAAAAALVPAFAAADPIPQPKVPFSADTIMEAGGIPMTGKLYHAPDRQRIEQSIQDVKVIVIARHDRNIGWMIMGTEQAYMELSLDESKKQSGSFAGCEMQQKKQREETVNGVRTTKSLVTVSCPDGSAYDGTMWLSKDGIMVKMEATATDAGNRFPFRLELKNIRIGKQDPNLFEIPAGYEKLGIGGIMGAVGTMMKALPEQEATIDVTTTQPPSATKPVTEDSGRGAAQRQRGN